MDVSTILTDAQIAQGQLVTWMDQHNLGHGPIEAARRLSGGTQNVLLLLERGGSRYVLRRPPINPRPESNQTMRREAQVLGALAGTSVPHARLIAACTDEAEFGFAFYLMEPIDGCNLTEGLPTFAEATSTQRAMGFSLVDALAALGRVDAIAVGLQDFGKSDGFLERQVGRWKAQLDGYEKFKGWRGAGTLPGVNRVATWLDANRPAMFSPGIQHGDFHLGNVMFAHRSPEVAAIIDWELATLGDPLLDLGWLLATWPRPDGLGGAFDIQPWCGFPSADELVERYAAGSERSLAAIGWYEVLACYKLGILQEGTMARAQAGLAPMETGRHLHGLAVQMFTRAQERIADHTGAVRHADASGDGIVETKTS